MTAFPVGKTVYTKSGRQGVIAHLPGRYSHYLNRKAYVLWQGNKSPSNVWLSGLTTIAPKK